MSSAAETFPLFALIVLLFSNSSIAQEPVSFEDLTEPQYQQKVDQYGGQGFSITEVAVKTDTGDVRFDVKFENRKEISVWFGHHHLTDKAFRTHSKSYSNKGLELSIHIKYRLSGRNLHLGIWKEKKATPRVVWQPDDTIPTTGLTNAESEPLTNLLTAFIRENQIPGATLAVSKNGKLIFERGFGYSEIESKTKMQPTSMLRIASISKPITATAILHLVQEEKIKLDDRVFEILNHKPMRGEKIKDSRLAKITVQQLLRHTAGFDRDASFDPMFRSRQIANDLRVSCPPSADQIIKYMLTQPLDFAPGEGYGYSNFGYCLLGRVIEKISGQKYEDYVRNEILKPIGAGNMFCGKTRLDARRPEEAVYYQDDDRRALSIFGRNKMTEPPYGAFCVEAMDSHGGWVGSASDLVNFADVFNQPEKGNLLSAESIREMFTCPDVDYWLRRDGSKKNVYYGMGWNVRAYRHGFSNWHMGKLPGTSTLLVRRLDGLNWAVMCNTSKCKDGTVPAEKLDRLINRALNRMYR